MVKHFGPRPSENSLDSKSLTKVLSDAIGSRVNIFDSPKTELGQNTAYRLFHGQGETPSLKFWNKIGIDRLGNAVWITYLGQAEFMDLIPKLEPVRPIIEALGITRAVVLARPAQEAPEEPILWFGKDQDPEVVQEWGIKYQARLKTVKNPGLFLDHLDLRRTLIQGLVGSRVLNTFCYTGSLSFAAAKGGAKKVTSVDLSGTTIAWAKQNFELNPELGGTEMDWISGDVFEYFSKFQKRGEKFDTVILDPPSFSRAPKQVFSTQKDLEKLHFEALKVLDHKGLLITSINSANIDPKFYLSQVVAASKNLGVRLQILKTLEQGWTFPTDASFADLRYLKGWIFRVFE